MSFGVTNKGGGFDARDRLPQQHIPAVGGVKIKNGEWYKVKAVIEGTKYTLYINDKKQGEVSDKVYDKSGKIGIWCWETKASFDDVKITGRNVKSLAVDPQSKLASVWGKLKRE
ncbi:MAG: family 16 glycoside hydrolase [Candidatus Poribacteria bacterium]